MSIEFLYSIAVFIPFVLMPLFLPMVVLLAHRKNLTDAPNGRKLQSMPVAVMGGTAILLVVSITALIINIFYDISYMYPVYCMMVVMYIFGIVDDNVGLSWQYKAVLQLFAIILLLVGTNYGVHSLYGLFGIEEIPLWLTYLLSIFVGLLIFNAINFADGIDGLASGLGIMVSFVMAYWNIRHGFVPHALLSFTIAGALIAFFTYNVFSRRYKIYMGDSGTLLLGVFIYISVCTNSYNSLDGTYLADNYHISFVLALLSAMIFDFFRVVFTRILGGHAPVEADRQHLHHIFVDAGMSHFLATLVIIFLNVIVLLAWHLTASNGMNITLQLFVVIAVGIVMIWSPYFYISHLRDKRIYKYNKLKKRFLLASSHADIIYNFINRIVDGRRAKNASHLKK